MGGSQQIPSLLSLEQLKTRLHQDHSLPVKDLEVLDTNVYRVKVNDGGDLVARIVPHQADDPVDIAKVAETIKYIKAQGFPAEDVVDVPGKAFDGTDNKDGGPPCSIMFTRFVAGGKKPERNKVTFYRLGKLLGKLASLDVPAGTPAGGAWHHVALSSDARSEATLISEKLCEFLEKQGHPPDAAESKRIERLREELGRISNMSVNDLPESLVHADLVPVNVIAQPPVGGSEHDRWTVIDWLGVGRGPRIFALGFLVAAASARGTLGLINAVIKGYLASGIRDFPTKGELDERLAVCIYARFLVMTCWQVVVGGTTAARVVSEMPDLVKMGETGAQRVREVVASVDAS